MRLFLNIIKLDYLTRVRSYSFLITLCASLAISYTFVPEPNASYSTIRIGDHVGYYNSAWFGYVTATMTSIFLSLIGFYLINTSIKKDIKTKVGQIIASTRVNNTTYLLSKVFSNFLILITIVSITFLMSIVLFTLYNDGFRFELFQFVKPYLIITIPSMFFLSAIAVIFEVILGRYSVIQNILFFIMFSFSLAVSPQSEMRYALDVFGSKIVLDTMEQSVREVLPLDEDSEMTIGYVLGNTTKAKKFSFEGIDFPSYFLVSRLTWMFIGILLVGLVAPFFQRFNMRDILPSEKTVKQILPKAELKDINLTQLPKLQKSTNILPLVRTEVFLLLRKGNKWLLGLNAIGMILLAVLNIEFAHKFVLPILWFLQVNRLSDLTTKEVENDVHYFSFTSLRPISRLLLSQLCAGLLLVLFLALPLTLRYIFLMKFNVVMFIIVGGVFVLFLAAFLGIFTKQKKLFEVLFFFITYVNLNQIPFFDYFGGVSQNIDHIFYVFTVIVMMVIAGFYKRYYDLRR